MWSIFLRLSRAGVSARAALYADLDGERYSLGPFGRPNIQTAIVTR
jgi:hypothetical protein